MMIILEISVILLMVVVVICYINNGALCAQNEELQQTIQQLVDQIDQIKAKQRVFEQRFMMMNNPDRGSDT